MKYLNLNNSEMRELLYIRRERFVLYVITLSIISLSSYMLLQSVIKTSMNSFFALLFSMAYTVYVLYTNRDYLKELIFKQKKVYRGALSFKTFYHNNKKGKYLFNVDGRIFYVDRKNFECIKEGDIVEFHVSSSTKHLFGVRKVE
jgi:hypothetical protein